MRFVCCWATPFFGSMFWRSAELQHFRVPCMSIWISESLRLHSFSVRCGRCRHTTDIFFHFSFFFLTCKILLILVFSCWLNWKLLFYYCSDVCVCRTQAHNKMRWNSAGMPRLLGEPAAIHTRRIYYIKSTQMCVTSDLKKDPVVGIVLKILRNKKSNIWHDYEKETTETNLMENNPTSNLAKNQNCSM